MYSLSSIDSINQPTTSSISFSHVHKEEESKKLCRILRFTSSADMIFTHLLATDLSKHRRDQGGGFAAVLNRSYDYSHKHNPRATQGRQFCITENGYMGLVPKYSQKGDLVVILHGAKTPYVLRKYECMYGDDCEVEMQCYQLVGEAYIHGIICDHKTLLVDRMEQAFILL